MGVYNKEEEQILRQFVQQHGYRSVHIINMLNGEVLGSVEGNGSETDLKILLPLITDFFSKIKSSSMEIPLELEMSFPTMDLYAKIIDNHEDPRLIIVLIWQNTISYRHDTEILLKQLHEHNYLG